MSDVSWEIRWSYFSLTNEGREFSIQRNLPVASASEEAQRVLKRREGEGEGEGEGESKTVAWCTSFLSGTPLEFNMHLPCVSCCLSNEHRKLWKTMNTFKKSEILEINGDLYDTVEFQK